MTFIDNMDNHQLAILEALDGRTIIYTPQGGLSKQIKGLFQNYTQMLGAENIDIISSQPVLSVRTSDVMGIKTDDTINIASKSYRIAVIRPDSEGITELILEVL